MLAVALLCLLAASSVLSVDVEPSIYSDLSGKVHLSTPNGICFDMGVASNKSAVSGLKGAKGDSGSAGRDGRDGRDGSAADCTCNCASSGSSGGSGSAKLTYPLFASDGPTWTNIDRSTKVSPNGGQTIGLVTFGLDIYYHVDVAPQYVVRFENADGDKVTTEYANIRRSRSTSYLNVLCVLPDVKHWAFDKRKATVSLWFRDVTKIEFGGKKNDDQIEFVTSWSDFQFTVGTTDLVITGTGFNAAEEMTATFTFANGTTMSAKAKPTSVTKIEFDLSPKSDQFRGTHTVTLVITSASGTMPFDGDAGGDQIVLQGDSKGAFAACSNYNLLDQSWRKVSNTGSFSPSCCFCDKAQKGTGLKADDWHRFDASIGGQMLAKCPSAAYKCGAYYGGWLYDQHPTVVGVEVSAKVCFSGYSCCSLEASVKVVNCGKYYIYYLPYVPTCNAVYCGSI